LKEESQDQLPVALPYVTANYIFDQTVFGANLAWTSMPIRSRVTIVI